MRAVAAEAWGGCGSFLKWEKSRGCIGCLLRQRFPGSARLLVVRSCLRALFDFTITSTVTGIPSFIAFSNFFIIIITFLMVICDQWPLILCFDVFVLVSAFFSNKVFSRYACNRESCPSHSQSGVHWPRCLALVVEWDWGGASASSGRNLPSSDLAFSKVLRDTTTKTRVHISREHTQHNLQKLQEPSCCTWGLAWPRSSSVTSISYINKQCPVSSPVRWILNRNGSLIRSL